MDPQSIDEFMNYILALKQSHEQQIRVLQQNIKNLEEELKNVKTTSKPIKSVK